MEILSKNLFFSDKENMAKDALDDEAPPGQNENEPSTTSPFCLLMKNDRGVRIGPKSILDIPVSFAPENMKMSEAIVILTVRKENGNAWKYDLTQEW